MVIKIWVDVNGEGLETKFKKLTPTFSVYKDLKWRVKNSPYRFMKV